MLIPLSQGNGWAARNGRIQFRRVTFGWSDLEFQPGATGPGGRDFRKTAGPRGRGLAADPEGGSPGRTNRASPVSPELEVVRLRAARSGGEQPLGITASGASSGHLLALVQLAGTVVKKQGPCTELYIKHIPKNKYAKVDEIPVISVD